MLSPISTATAVGIAAAILLSVAKSSPIPDTPANTIGAGNTQNYKTYTIISQQEVSGTPTIAAGLVEANQTGTYSEDYSVGTTWEVGVDLGLDVTDIIHLGLSLSVGGSVDHGTTSQVSLTPCPAAAPGDDQWTCGVLITPVMLQVVGTVEEHSSLSGYDSETTSSGGQISDFTVQMPVTDVNGNGEFTLDYCSCLGKNGWGSPGAPPLCPTNNHGC